ncbi:cytochrome c oxidase subunit II [Elioraea tepida]|uniref:Cytochrome c oxidase subunit 2 n=1 Tax=Elioraea tepida TaxID=2843330 RepID=A0A975U4W8_9PROT|nr:cytochrome c oxidase subunit II [Elioraea tepida]
MRAQGRCRQTVRGVLGVAALAGLAAMVLAVGAADASTTEVGAPVPWGMGMQASASPVKDRIHSLHNFLLVIITLITIFVLALLTYVVVRFRAQRNPVPSRTAHNTTLEVIWTVVPVLILVAIGVPSFRLLYFMDRAKEPDMTLKVTAFQWAWEYEYPDHDGIKFESYMIPTEELRPGQLRLLDVDNEVVVPAGKDIRVLVTSRDVIHSLFVPALGVQKYGIPGRTLETWFRADRPGVYYGQCNQICGVNHAFMPVVIRAVPEAEFTAWVKEAKRRFANDNTRPLPLVAAGDGEAGEVGLRLAEARRGSTSQ